MQQQDCRQDPTTGEWRCRDVGEPAPDPPDITDLPTVTSHGASWVDLWNRWEYDRLYRKQTGPEAPRDNSGGADGAASAVAAVDPCNEAVGTALAIGNPILPATGDKVESETDFMTNGEVPLYLKRTYSRYHPVKGLFGYSWSSNFDLHIFKSLDGQRITAYRDNNGEIEFVYKTTPTAAWYEDEPDPGSRIVDDGVGGYILYLQDNSVETYNAGGQITSQKNARGIGITFSYSGGYLHRATHTSGRYVQFGWTGDLLTSVLDPAGHTHSYGYISSPMNANFKWLNNVAQPGTPATLITYHYDGGISSGVLVGKSYNGVRYSTFAYDSSGRAISSEHTGGADKNTFTYTDANGVRTVVHTNPLGKQTTYEFVNGKLKSATGHASTYCPLSTYREATYDTNGYQDLVTDFGGKITDYDYNLKSQVVRKVVATGTPLAQETLYTWDANSRTTRIVVTGQTQTDYGYRADGLIGSLTVTNLSSHGVPGQQRITAYSYFMHPNGMLKTVVEDGPLPGAGDAVTRELDSVGNVIAVTNGLDHAVRYANHNGFGLPGRVTGVNGAVTDYTYDARGNVLTMTSWVNGAAQMTSNTYDNRGRVIKTTTPDAVATNFFYDNNNRLIKTTRNEPNSPYAAQVTSLTGASSPIGFSEVGQPETEEGLVVAPMACHPQPDCETDPPIVYAAQFVGQTVPAAMIAGQTYSVTIQMKNVGDTAWSSPAFQLSSVNPVDNTTWGLNRVAVPGTVSPQQTATFTFNVTAPAATGTYNFQWQMLRATRFGSMSANVAVNVQPAPFDAATFVSQAVPSAMTRGAVYPVTVQMKNSGTTTWTAANNYRLGSANPQDNTRWGLSRVALPATIAPGATATFSFNVTAPATEGTYNFQWRMLREGVAWFGPNSTNLAVEIQPPPPPPVAFQKFTYNLNGDLTVIETGIEYQVQSSGLAALAAGGSVSTDGMNQPNLCHPYPDCYEPPNPGDPNPPSWETVVLTRSYIDYDELGRVRARRGYDINGNSPNVRYTYDAVGMIKTVKDSLGRDTTMTYDVLGRLATSTDPRNGIARFEYDLGGRLTKATDPRGLITTYIYDGFGQLWSQTSPDSGTTAFEYDASGQRTKMTRADAQATTYGYDGLGRIKTVSAGSLVQSFDYDTCTYGKGLLCKATDQTGNVNYTYTPHGQLATQISAMPGGSVSLGYMYDGMGRISNINYPEIAVGYTYANGRVASMTTTIAGVTKTVISNLAYRPFGPAIGWTYGNGLTHAYDYDLDGRVTGISTNNTSGPLQSLTYGYNANNLITKITNGINAGATQNYIYDELSRLQAFDTGYGDTLTHTYDANGNRTKVDWLKAGVTTSTLYAVALNSNRLNGLSGGATRGYSYDDNGNPSAITGLGDSYAYDAFNRLSSVTRGGATTNYAVNALGQRVYKNGPGGQYWFAYAPDGSLLADYKTGQGWTKYLRLGSEVVGFVRSGQLYFVSNDHLSRPEMVTDSTKAVVWRANNYAFNRSLPINQIGEFNIGFPGQYYDAETGHWYNINRDYDDDTGRYLQTDPVGLRGGLNTYTYVGGNPVTRFDPFGLESEENWFPPSGIGTYWVSAQNYNSPAGTYTISTHGILGTRYMVGPNGKPMNGQQAWNQIKDKFNKGGYTKIRLAVCEAGKDDASGRSLADDLAAWSGKPVEATRNEVGYPINGQVFIGSPVPGYIPPQTVPIPNAQWEQFP